MKKRGLRTAAVLFVALSALTLGCGPTSSDGSQSEKKDENVSPAPAKKAESTTEIKNKMLNAIDHYTDVQGKFIDVNRVGYEREGEFIVRLGSEPGSYIKLQNKADHSLILEAYSNGQEQTVYEYLGKSKQSRKTGQKTVMPKEARGALERHYKNSNDEWVEEYRDDPTDATPLIEVVFPQVQAFLMDDFTKNYKVVGQEQLLGREATVVEGRLDQAMSEKQQTETFKFWVDTNTGILLKLIETNSAGEVTRALGVTELKVDQGVPDLETARKHMEQL